MKKLLVVIVFILIGITLSAQTSSPFTGSLLWKVTGNDLQEPSYILGTFHLFPESFTDSIPGLRNAINATHQVVGELDMLDMASAQMVILQSAMLPEEESYKKLLSEEEYSRLDDGLKNIIGIGLDQMGTYKPGMISTSLMIILYTRIDPNYNPTTFEGIDTYMQRIAREENKPIIALETVQEQSHLLFDAHPQQWQMQNLLCTLDHIEDAVENMSSSIDDYRRGDLNKMYNDSFYSNDDPCVSFSIASKDGMLANRNNKWMEKLPSIIHENPSLVVVGALHLAGEEGILYQLDKLGYKVEAVK